MRSSIIFFALLALATAWPRHDMQQNQQEELLRNVLQYFNDAEIEGGTIYNLILFVHSYSYNIHSA